MLEFKHASDLLENDTIRMLVSLFLLILASWPLRFIPHGHPRYAYSTILATILQLWVFSKPVIAIHLFAVLVYGLVRMSPKRCGGIVTVTSMLFLSWYHLHAIWYRYGEETMDEIVLLMVLVCKYSLFAFAYEDGHKEPTEKKHLDHKERELNKITQTVSFIEFFGYLQFLPSSIMGPPFEYRLYRNFINSAQPYTNIPSPAPALRKTAKEFAICLALYAFGMVVFPTSYMKTDSFWESSGLTIGVYSFISITTLRFKYYTAWKVSIAAVHSSGLSYDGAGNFNTIVHCKPEIVETTPHIRDKISNWNIMVQEWLRKCVYSRSPFKSRMLSQLYVFMVSAFWHGYYIGYYFSFFLWFVQVYVQGLIFKYSQVQGNALTKAYSSLGKLGPVVTFLLSNLYFNVNATFFYLLEASLCWKFMGKVWYLPQVSLIVAAVVLTVLPGPRKKKQA